MEASYNVAITVQLFDNSSQRDALVDTIRESTTRSHDSTGV